MLTNVQAGTNVQEIADGIYRINTPIELPGVAGAFSFNQYLVDDDEPLLFHTGPRRLFPLVSEAISRVIDLARLRHIGLSHFEADECGAMNELLAAAPHATPFCSAVAAMVSVNDVADRPARALADGETLVIGRHALRWYDTPHMPHGWDCGLMMDTRTGTFFCGDLFTQPGRGDAALTTADILGPSEAFRQPMDYYAHAPNTGATLARLAAASRPRSPACTAAHGRATARRCCGTSPRRWGPDLGRRPQSLTSGPSSGRIPELSRIELSWSVATRRFGGGCWMPRSAPPPLPWAPPRPWEDGLPPPAEPVASPPVRGSSVLPVAPPCGSWRRWLLLAMRTLLVASSCPRRGNGCARRLTPSAPARSAAP
jgi:glyoxylase-like metal-dependent hydrolase (beta-lactamase superfamily II)